jgi:hypothetical protein
MTPISLSGIWTVGPFAAAARPLAAASPVDLFTALLKASGGDIEVQGFDRRPAGTCTTTSCPTT